MQTASTQGQKESIYPTSQAVNTGLYPTLVGLMGIKAQTCFWSQGATCWLEPCTTQYPISSGVSPG